MGGGRRAKITNKCGATNEEIKNGVKNGREREKKREREKASHTHTEREKGRKK